MSLYCIIVIFIHLPFSLPEMRPKRSDVYKLPGLASRTDRLGRWNIEPISGF